MKITIGEIILGLIIAGCLALVLFGCIGRPQLVGSVPRVPRPIAEPQAITCRISGQAEPCYIVLQQDWRALETEIRLACLELYPTEPQKCK